MSDSILKLIALRQIRDTLAELHVASATTGLPYSHMPTLQEERTTQDIVRLMFGHDFWWSLQLLAFEHAAWKLVKICDSCRRTYTREQFLALPKPWRGDHQMGPDPRRPLLLRNCACKTTISMTSDCAPGCSDCQRLFEQEEIAL